MASLLDLVGDNDLAGIDRYLQKVHRDRGKAGLLNEITTCEHEGRNAKSAIHRAAMRGRAQVIERFIKEDVCVDVLDDQGNTPLHLATDLGRARAAKCLLEAGASSEIRNCFGRTAKDMSQENSWDAKDTAEGKAFIRRMLAGQPVAVDELPPEPPSSKEAFPRRAPAPKVVEEPVVTVPELEQEVAAEIPVERAEDPVSYDNLTDFDFATQVDLKALVRNSDEAAVKRWLRCANSQAVRERFWPHVPHQTGLTAFIGSCEDGDAGQDTRIALSILHIAALRGNVNIMRMLLETRINPNVTNDQGSTPLHFAVDVDRPESAQLLLRYKANPYLRNNFGRTPYEMRDGRGQQVVPHHSDRMVTIIFQSHMDTSDKDCSICQEEFREGEVLRALPCLHKFHAICIDEWLSRSSSRHCPSCWHCMDETDLPDEDPVITAAAGYIGTHIRV